jgi:hypothetical protein
MADTKRWTTLRCINCDENEFVTVHEIRHHPSGGTADPVIGKRCNSCGWMANVGAMWNKIQIAAQQERIRELTEEAQANLDGLVADRERGAEQSAGGKAYEAAQRAKEPVDPRETSLGKMLDDPELEKNT